MIQSHKIFGDNMFILLSKNSSEKVRINTHQILFYEKGSDMYKHPTSITLKGNISVHVMETPEQIDKILAQLDFFIKESKKEIKKEDSTIDDYNSINDYSNYYNEYGKY